MTPLRQLDPVFPLAGFPADRAPMRAPRLACGVKLGPQVGVLGDRALLRSWATRCARAVNLVGSPRPTRSATSID